MRTSERRAVHFVEDATRFHDEMVLIVRDWALFYRMDFHPGLDPDREKVEVEKLVEIWHGTRKQILGFVDVYLSASNGRDSCRIAFEIKSHEPDLATLRQMKFYRVHLEANAYVLVSPKVDRWRGLFEDEGFKVWAADEELLLCGGNWGLNVLGGQLVYYGHDPAIEARVDSLMKRLAHAPLMRGKGGIRVGSDPH